jgi:thioredoxin 1
MAYEISSAEFEQEVLKSETPVLVDFWAHWCAPCRAFAPILEEIAKQYEGEIKVCKVNVDENPDLASQYGIMSIPTLILFKDGEIKEKSIGMVPKENIEKLIQPYIS